MSCACYFERLVQVCASCGDGGSVGIISAVNHWEPPSGITCLWLCDACLSEAETLGGFGE